MSTNATTTAAPTTKVITPKAILSYPWIAKPQPARADDATKASQYGCALIFADGTDLAPLKAAVRLAAETKWPGKADALWAAGMENGGLRSPFRKDWERRKYPKDSVYVNCRSDAKPSVVYAHAGPDGKAAVMPDDKVGAELYPGCIVRASLVAFAYDRNGNKGVTFGLNNIQLVGAGTRLDNRVDAQDEFDVDLTAVPASIDHLL